MASAEARGGPDRLDDVSAGADDGVANAEPLRQSRRYGGGERAAGTVRVARVDARALENLRNIAAHQQDVGDHRSLVVSSFHQDGLRSERQQPISELGSRD